MSTDFTGCIKHKYSCSPCFVLQSDWCFKNLYGNSQQKINMRSATCWTGHAGSSRTAGRCNMNEVSIHYHKSLRYPGPNMHMYSPWLLHLCLCECVSGWVLHPWDHRGLSVCVSVCVGVSMCRCDICRCEHVQV